MKCSWLALTDPRDVARVESKTVIVTQEQRDTTPIPKTGTSQLGRWMSEEDFEKAFNTRFPGCMQGRQEKDGCHWTSRITGALLLIITAKNTSWRFKYKDSSFQHSSFHKEGRSHVGKSEWIFSRSRTATKQQMGGEVRGEGCRPQK